MTNTAALATRTSTSVGLLVLRIMIGGVFAAHGAQKVFEFTIADTTASFSAMGVPLPELAAPVVSFVELIGGVMLVLGLLVRPVGVILAGDMLIALLIVHLPAGLWVANGGYELVAVLGAAALAVAIAGAGEFSLDQRILRRRVPEWLVV